MAEQILTNPAALNALKRHQLVSLSKRYGLKASGKNGDMVERLLLHAATLPSGESMQVPTPDQCTTPHHAHADFIPAAPPDTPTPMSPGADREDDVDTPMIDLADRFRLDKKASMISVNSDNWDKLSESGASFISPMRGVDAGSVRSWKSAGNGEPLSDFGDVGRPQRAQSTSSRNSMFAFASSLKRSGTKTFLGPRSASQSSGLTAEAPVETAAEVEMEAEEATEIGPIPPSPASTVGIPRRHSRLTLFERPSTLRLCSPTAGPHTPRARGSDLPLVGSAHRLQELRARRSTPFQSPHDTAAGQPGLSRKSMPTLDDYSTTSLSSLYPPLPGFQADIDAPPVPQIPGHYPAQNLQHKVSETFVFGSPEHAVSSTQFSEAAQAMLRQMNEQLPEDARMGDEVLRGSKADMKRMVSVTSGLGEGGWGLVERFEGKKDRFAAAHERQFAKMKSISQEAGQDAKTRKPSTKTPLLPVTPGQKRKLSSASGVTDVPTAPNGGPVNASGRPAKKSRVSTGPNMLGSLRDAGRSVMTLLGDGEGRSPEKKRPGPKPQRSRLSMKGDGLRSRLSMLRSGFRRPAMARPDMTSQERSAALHKSLRRRSAELSTIVKRAPDLPINPPMSLRTTNRKERMPSTSAQTVMSTASSKMPQRKPLPDFDGRVASASTAVLGSSVSSADTSKMARSQTGSVSSSLKKQSQDLIRNARPAPAPPARELSAGSSSSGGSAPGLVRTSSTLYASTASSRARVQATVRPAAKSASRPLPMAPPPVPPASRPSPAPITSMGPPSIPAHAISPPSSFKAHGIATYNRFGAGESRENLFEENFQHPPLPAPALPSTAVTSPSCITARAKSGTLGRFGPVSRSSPVKSPSAASRFRHKDSGLAAFKSKGNLKDEADMQRKRAEVKAKSERRTEEKELREMLGDIGNM